MGKLCECWEKSQFDETNETEKSVKVAGRNSPVFCVLKSWVKKQKLGGAAADLLDP